MTKEGTRTSSGNGKNWWHLRPRWPIALRSKRVSSKKVDNILADPSSHVTGSSYDGSISRSYHQRTVDFEVEDDLSSVSDMSISRKPSFGKRKDRRQGRNEPTSVPFEVFVPFGLDTQVAAEQAPEEATCQNGRREGKEQDIDEPVQEPSPEESGNLKDLVEEHPVERELDPEGQARLQAIRQLASMLGPDHPDVLFSMEYLGKHLYRRGDIGGAEAIQNHVQERRDVLRQATVDACFTANPRCI